jgi:putative adenylate-forming enzyme
MRVIVRHAAARSPYYRERFAGLDLDGPFALDDLPTLDKPTMLEHFDAIVTNPGIRLTEIEARLADMHGDALYLGDYRVLCTGGTSGRRGTYVYSASDWRDLLAGMVRWMSGFLGLPPRLPRRRRIASVAADSPLHMTARVAASMDVGLNAFLRLDARTPLDELVTRLNAFGPEALVAYPSSASLLAEEQLAGRLRIAPRVICTTSEVRTAEMEERIVAAWGVRPYDCYASTETGVLAVDCERHRGLHLLTDQTLVEIIDGNGRPVPAGVPGHRVLVTSLVNRTQPLIRYEISDLVTLSADPCPCGRPFPLIAAVDGRSDDMLRLPGTDGAVVVVHPLAIRSPLARIAGLRQYRVIHDASGLTVEAVVSSPGALQDIAARLREALDGQRVATLPLQVRPVAEIARHGVSGKIKLIESRAPAIERP